MSALPAITDDDLVRLAAAPALFFPNGGVTVSTLRTEIRNGNLVPIRLAGKYFVTAKTAWRALGMPPEPCSPRQILDEVETSLLGHSLNLSLLRGDERMKFVQQKDAFEKALRDNPSTADLYAAFFFMKKPNEYRYHDIAFYQIAIHKASVIRDRLTAVIEVERRKAEAERQKVEREALEQLEKIASESGEGWVYFIESGGHIKIGFSSNVPSRMAQIETSSPFPVVILRQERGTVASEEAYHRRFAVCHLRREWFRFEGALKEFLEERK